MKRVFTFFAAALFVVALNFTANAQYSYVIEVNEPEAVTIPVIGVNLGWGPHFAPGEPFTGEVAVVADSSGTDLGCVGSEPGVYDNKIAVVRRGECAFVLKIQNAVASGAIAVLIVNSETGTPTDIGVAAGTAALDVPAMMIPFAEGDALIAAISDGATSEVTVVRQPLDPGDVNIIWGGPGDPNSEFAGGFNDWIATGTLCTEGDAENATWTWGIDPKPSGGFSGNRGNIASLSSHNGAVIFDSNFLDDGGVQGAFGEGPCPAPHRGELTSPVIDLSENLSVAVRFNNYYRRFAGPGSSQAVVGSYIEVTNDGGETWTSFAVNGGLAVNAASAVNDVQVVDISAVAAGQEAVQIRFVFDGDYYFWSVDDVYLISLPDNSLSLERVFSPIVTLYTPESQLGPLFADVDGWPFAAAMKNRGGNVVTATVGVTITDAEGGEVWSTTQDIELVPGPDDVVINLDETFDPVGLEPGEYFVDYELFQEGVEDFDPADNAQGYNFFITDNSFWQSGEARSSVSPAGLTSATWAYGASIGTILTPGIDLAVNSIDAYVNIISGNADEMDGQIVSIYMIEDQGIATGDEYGTNNAFAALGEYELSAADNNQIFNVPIESFDGEPVFVMKDTTSYLAMVEVPNGFRVGADNQMRNFPTNMAAGSVLLFSRLHLNGAFSATFRNWTPYVRLNLEVLVNANTPELPESFVTMFPNPATDQAFVNLSFDKAMSATIAISDLSGRLINYNVVENVKDHTEIINTSSLPAGTYTVHVGTDEGVTVKKLMVIK